MQTSGRGTFANILSLLVSGFGFLASLLAAIAVGVYALANLVSQSFPASELTPLFILIWISGLLGLLALPAVVLSVLRLMGRTVELPSLGGGFRLASFFLLVWPLALAGGGLVSGIERISWLLLPPLHVLAIGLPIWWLVEMARRQLPLGSQQRGWGMLDTSLFITTPSVIVLEIVMMFVLVVIFAGVVSMHPEWASGIQSLAQRLLLLQNNPEAILRVLQPMVQSPLVVLGVLALLALLIPMLEEFMKPLAVWFLAGRLSPAGGFAAGAICGGAFALLESLMTLSGASGGAGWLGLAIARAGTGMLHITTTSLMGWGLANAWCNRDYIRLGMAYALAIAWHGVWNGLSILSGIGAIITNPGADLAWVLRLAGVAPIGLLVLVVSMFLFLAGGNRILRRQAAAQAVVLDAVGAQLHP